jgi:SAM-dependent methyltransferase
MTTVYAQYLQRAAATPGIAELKARTWELVGLRPGMRVIDVGCGPGIDSVPLGRRVGPTGHVVGVDGDPGMVAMADAAAVRAGVRGWVEHKTASAHALPVASAGFDCWHAERLLQHLRPPLPQRAVAEAMRVVVAGGVLAVADTDWATLSIDADELELERRLVGLHTLSYGNGVAGRQLPRLLRLAGALDVRVERVVLELDLATVATLLAPVEQRALAGGWLRPAEWQLWRAELARLQSGGVFGATVTMALAVGRRP